MEFKEYLKQIIERFNGYGEIEFNLGIDTNMEVNPNSQNRIKFKIQCHGK